MGIFSFFKKKELPAGEDFVQSSLEQDEQKDNQAEDISSQIDEALSSNDEGVTDGEAINNVSENQEENQLENSTEAEEKIGEGPDKMAKAKIIGGVAYKSLTSILGIKTVTDAVGAIAGAFGWKTGQQTDIYQYVDQSRKTKKDRENLIEDSQISELAYRMSSFKNNLKQDELYNLMLSKIKDYKELPNESKEVVNMTEEQKEKLEEIKEIRKQRNLKQNRNEEYFSLSDEDKEKVEEAFNRKEAYFKVIKIVMDCRYSSFDLSTRLAKAQEIVDIFDEFNINFDIDNITSLSSDEEKQTELNDFFSTMEEKVEYIFSPGSEYENLTSKYINEESFLIKNRLSNLAQDYNRSLKEALSNNSLNPADYDEMRKRLNIILNKQVENYKDGEYQEMNQKEIDKILKDYIHSKVALSSLVKDGLNTAFVLTGGVAAGAFRGLTYGGLALAERYQKNEKEYRKKYSWNEVGQKIGFGSKMHDLFIGGIKETWAGLKGEKYQNKYEIDEEGEMKRQESSEKIDNGLQKFGARAKAIGELARVFGIGTQAITAGITDGLNFEHAANGFAKTFTEGNVFVNVSKNWYDNARIDQRIAKSFGKIFGGETAVFGAAGNPESPDSEAVLNNIDSASSLDDDQKMISDLIDSKIVVSKGGSISESLGHPVDSSRGITLISRGPGGPNDITIYKDYNPDNIQPGVKLIEKDGEIIALDENPQNTAYYDEHSGVEELKPIESSDHKEIMAEQKRLREDVSVTTEDPAAVTNEAPVESTISEAEIEAMNPETVAQPAAQSTEDISATTEDPAAVTNEAPAKPTIPEAEIEAMNPEIKDSEIEVPKKLSNWTTENYKEALYGPLAAKDTTYQNLAEAAKGDDQKFFEKFILSKREGGIISNGLESKDYQDLDSDIDRIYYSKELDNNQKIEILEKIKEELNSSKLTDHINNDFLKTNTKSQYNILKDVIDDDIAIINKSYKSEINQQDLDGVVLGVKENQNANISVSNESFDEYERQDKLLEVWTNPKNDFSLIKETIIKEIPQGQSINVGSLNFKNNNGVLSCEYGVVTENNYQQFILQHAGMLNGLTASSEFEGLIKNSPSISGAISENIGHESFAAIKESINVYDKFIDPGIKYEDKLAVLNSVLSDKQSLKIHDLTFARLNDKIYLVTDSKKVIELKDKTVVNDILEARQAAMKAALARIQATSN